MLPDHEELCQLYAYPDPVPVQGWVRGSMISSVDGSSVGADGLSGTLGTPPDRRIMRLLRGLADVVLVAAGTVREEGYGLPDLYPEHAADRAALGQPAVASMAVVTGSGHLPERMLGDIRLDPEDPSHRSDHRLVVLTTASAGPTTLSRLRNALGVDAVVECGERQVDPAAAVSALCDRGMKRVLCEGGPSWLATMSAAGTLDELTVTVAPMLVGGAGARIMHGADVTTGLRLAHSIADSDTLLTRWLTVREESQR